MDKQIPKSTKYYRLRKEYVGKEYRPTKPKYFKVIKPKTEAMIETEARLKEILIKKQQEKEALMELEKEKEQIKKEAGDFWKTYNQFKNENNSVFDIDKYLNILLEIKKKI